MDLRHVDGHLRMQSRLRLSLSRPKAEQVFMTLQETEVTGKKEKQDAKHISTWLILTQMANPRAQPYHALTVFFVVGVVIERGGEAHTPTSNHQNAPSSAATSSDPDGGHDETPSTSKPQNSISAETVFGLDLENPWAVGAFVMVWLVLAVALLRLGRLAWMALLCVAILTGALDVAEVGRQWTSAHLTVAIFALGVLLAHVVLVVLAGFVLARSRHGNKLSFG